MSKNMWKIKVEIMMRKQDEYEFPEFIRNLRMLLGFSRKSVAQDLGFSLAKLIDLERGYFCKLPDEEVLLKITDYYDLPQDFLKSKVLVFVAKKEMEKTQKKYKSFMESYPNIPTHLLNASVQSANQMKV